MSSLIVPIVKISEINKHPNADTLSVVKFEGYGWQSIIKTGQYEVGDLVIFVPPDAILPQSIIDLEKIDYLKGSAGKVGSIKLRGVVSHGLLLPISIFPQLGIRYLPLPGENVAEHLNITKWEAPEPEYLTRGQYKEKTAKKKNPLFPEYTKIEKIEFFEGIFKEGEPVWISEKIHGTNFRCGWVLKEKISWLDKIKQYFGKFDPYEFVCGSHHVQMSVEKPHKSWYDQVVEFNHYQKLALKLKNKIPKGYIIYGEIFGKGIQDLTYGMKTTDFVVFDVMHDGKYLDFEEMLVVLDYMGLSENLVPILYQGPYSEEVKDALTKGMSILAAYNLTQQIKEGVVIKPVIERFDSVLGRVVVKSINTDYSTRKNGTEYQ